MKISKSEITHYIPQKEPFVMIDELLEATEEKFVSTYAIKENAVLNNGKELKEVGLIENMAQTVAAGFTFLDKSRAGSDEKPKVGFIGSLNRLKVSEIPSFGDVLITTVIPQMSFENITLVAAEVKIDERIIASCELKIAIVDELSMQQ